MSDDAPSTKGFVQRWIDKLRKAIARPPQNRKEVLDQLHEAHKHHLIDQDGLSMIEGVMVVSEMQVRDIMIPRANMIGVERGQSLADILPIITESAHSRFPVFGDNKDEVIGILMAKDLLPYFQNAQSSSFNIRDILRPAVFIPESKRLNVLLREFRANRNHIAIVIDEYGIPDGLVTIEDVLEQIVGEIIDEHDIDEGMYIMQHTDNRYTIKALTPIEDFNEHFRCRYSDEEFDTIGGLLMNRFGHMPKRDETITIDQFQFKVLHADSRRIHLLQMTLVAQDNQTQPVDSVA